MRVVTDGVVIAAGNIGPRRGGRDRVVANGNLDIVEVSTYILSSRDKDIVDGITLS